MFKDEKDMCCCHEHGKGCGCCNGNDKSCDCGCHEHKHEHEHEEHEHDESCGCHEHKHEHEGHEHGESCGCSCDKNKDFCECSCNHDNNENEKENKESMQEPTGPFCQSCAMPLMKPEDFGTNADGSKNEDYCIYCFKDGQFTEPNLTVEEMMDMVAHMLIKIAKMPEEKARVMVQILIPQLKRWRKEED